ANHAPNCRKQRNLDVLTVGVPLALLVRNVSGQQSQILHRITVLTLCVRRARHMTYEFTAGAIRRRLHAVVGQSVYHPNKISLIKYFSPLRKPSAFPIANARNRTSET